MRNDSHQVKVQNVNITSTYTRAALKAAQMMNTMIKTRARAARKHDYDRRRKDENCFSRRPKKFHPLHHFATQKGSLFAFAHHFAIFAEKKRARQSQEVKNKIKK